jgi:[ribosomal protein S5]-alanine N-acetyltransferase
VRLSGSFTNLRLLSEEDAEVTLKWRNSSRARFLNTGAESVVDQRRWIRSALESPRDLNMIIEYLEQPVGMLSLMDISSNLNFKSAETGRFIIGEPEFCASKPVAFDSLLVHYDFAFEYLKLDYLYGHINPENSKMARFHKYCGVDLVEEESQFFDLNKFKKGYVNIQINRDIYFSVVRNKLLRFLCII